MIEFIIFLIFTAFFWFMTIVTLKGVDWILLSGVNILPKEERRKYKEKHDMIAMNRFIGKRIFLPVSVAGTVFMPPLILGAEFVHSAWFVIPLVIAVVAMLLLIFSALPKILGSAFEKTGNPSSTSSQHGRESQ